MEKVKIGIPRSLYYYEYGNLYKDFFEKLGFEVIVSKKTDNEIYYNGNNLATDEMCLSLKIFLLNQAVKEMGCNKVAYAHHRDDIIETMLLSLIFEGRFYSFSPRTYLDRMDLTVIRPIMFVDEADVIGFKNKYDLPVVKSRCPIDGYTKRQYAKELVRQLNQEHPGAKQRGILPAPESSHAIKVAMDEALKCKETGEEKTIVFGLTGTGYFDMVAYGKYNDGQMSDYIPTDEDLAKGFATIPNIPELNQ